MRSILFYLFLILLVIGGFFAIGYFTKNESVVTQVKVAATPEICWNIYKDPQTMDQWVEDFKAIELVSGTDNIVGAKYKLILNDPEEGETVMNQELTQVEPYRLQTMKYNNQFLDGSISTTFEEQGDSTLITSTNKYTANTVLLRSIFHFAKGKVEVIAENQYQDLKMYIEKMHPRTPPPVESQSATPDSLLQNVEVDSL